MINPNLKKIENLLVLDPNLLMGMGGMCVCVGGEGGVVLMMQVFTYIMIRALSALNSVFSVKIGRHVFSLTSPKLL